MKGSAILKKLVLAVAVSVAARTVHAFGGWEILAAEAGYTYGGPVALAFAYCFAQTPPIRVFGTERTVCGLDWGSMACRAGNVYGVQASFIGGGVVEDLYGLQLGIFCNGFVSGEKVGVSDAVDYGRINGLQFGTFYGRAPTVNGIAVSGLFSEVKTVNGFQVSCFLNMANRVNGMQIGLVNVGSRVNGMQIGLVNSSTSGTDLQIGLVNRMPERSIECWPIVNFRF